MFVLTNTGTLSLGSSVTETDWLTKGCFLRAKIILLQCLNLNLVTLYPVQSQMSSLNDVIFCTEARKLLVIVNGCEVWELNLTLKHAQPQSGTIQSPWQLHSRQYKRVLSRWVAPLLLYSIFLSVALGNFAFFNFQMQKPNSRLFGFPRVHAVPAWGVFTGSYLCLTLIFLVNFSGMLEWDGGVPEEEWREPETDINCKCVGERRRERERERGREGAYIYIPRRLVFTDTTGLLHNLT